MIDRGFMKWQPFHSLTPLKDTVLDIEKQQRCTKPVLFPEEINLLNEEIMDAYYSKDFITITYYEAGKIKSITTTIKKINPNSKTIELGSKQILSFHQILRITSSE